MQPLIKLSVTVLLRINSHCFLRKHRRRHAARGLVLHKHKSSSLVNDHENRKRCRQKRGPLLNWPRSTWNWITWKTVFLFQKSVFSGRRRNNENMNGDMYCFLGHEVHFQILKPSTFLPGIDFFSSPEDFQMKAPYAERTTYTIPTERSARGELFPQQTPTRSWCAGTDPPRASRRNLSLADSCTRSPYSCRSPAVRKVKFHWATMSPFWLGLSCADLLLPKLSRMMPLKCRI